VKRNALEDLVHGVARPAQRDPGEVQARRRAHHRPVVLRDLIHEGATGLSADDLAAAAGCSRHAAYRAFTGAFGLTPGEYQRQLRVRTARRLLAGGVPPALAAAQAGFADQAHLTRWFRRYYGITPGGYRAAAGS
jgi:AraC-like DNA-binding protein